jgi:hypothetical protein
VSHEQDLTGDVKRVESFPFESGGVADISLGSMESKRIKGEKVRWTSNRCRLTSNGSTGGD